MCYPHGSLWTTKGASSNRTEPKKCLSGAEGFFFAGLGQTVR